MAIDLPQAQAAEVEFTGRGGVYRVINVDRGRWLVYGEGAVPYVGMLTERGMTYELHPMVPRGPDLVGRDLKELVLAL